MFDREFFSHFSSTLTKLKMCLSFCLIKMKLCRLKETFYRVDFFLFCLVKKLCNYENMHFDSRSATEIVLESDYDNL